MRVQARAPLGQRGISMSESNGQHRGLMPPGGPLWPSDITSSSAVCLTWIYIYRYIYIYIDIYTHTYIHNHSHTTIIP